MNRNFIRPSVIPLAAMVFSLLSPAALGGVPTLLNFQGRIVVGGAAYNGAGQFQFALVDGTGTTTFWSNDGTSSGGSEPSAVVSLTLTNGLYAVLLGDTTLAGMTQPLNASVFNNADVRLRVWFNDGAHGFERLAPDQRIAPVGYALVADTANNFAGSVSSAQLPGNLATTNFVLSQIPAVTNGVNGLNGTNGVNGVNGTNGLNGATGPQGSTGPQGPQGIQGIQGVQGVAGTNGANLLNAVTNLVGTSAAIPSISGNTGFVPTNYDASGAARAATNTLAAPALVGAVPLASLGNALTNFNAAPVTLAASLTVQGTLTNTSTVFLPTNTASFSFLSGAINADAVRHTNANQRAFLVGTAVLATPGTGAAGTPAAMTLVINQGPFTNTFPMILGNGGKTWITNAVPFNFPLNPNAVWYFTNLSDAASMAYLTNAAVIGQ